MLSTCVDCVSMITHVIYGTEPHACTNMTMKWLDLVQIDAVLLVDFRDSKDCFPRLPFLLGSLSGST